MTSFVSAALLTAALVGAGGGPDSGRAVPARLTEEAVRRVARAWKVEEDAVRLEWAGAANRSMAEARVTGILGRGRDGWFAAVLRDPDGPPISLRVRAGVAETVMVASRDLAAGAHVLAGDLRPELRIHWGAPAGRPAVRPGVGWEVKRPLAAGELGAYPALVPPLAVLAGEGVELRWQRDIVRVVASGIALNSAREGEDVRVRVVGREEPLSGRVTGPGLAWLQMEKPR